jgi:hypothetical protein
MPSGNEGETPVSENVPETLPVEAIPTVLHEGRYRLYQKPDGGLHLAYQRNDSDQEDHLELPGMMVALLNKAQEGNMSPMEFLKEAMKLRRG